MLLYCFRHSITKENLEHRYLGKRSDVSLNAEGRSLAVQAASTLQITPKIVISSPMCRCKETAAILFPGIELQTASGLEECDFGTFEGKNYLELTGNPDYQKWIDSNGTLPFPEGESRAAFQERCCQAVTSIVQRYSHANTIAIIAHEGTWRAVLSTLATPQKSFFDWKIPYCGYVSCLVAQAAPLRLQMNSNVI